MRKTYFILLISSLIISLTFFNSCDKEEIIDTTVESGYISGQVFADNGTTPIPMANVFVDYDGKILITQTDIDGYFELLVPAGERMLNIQTGNGSIFRTYVPVNVLANEYTEIPSASLKLTQVAEIAYIAGEYDNIEYLISALGYEATEITLDNLDDLSLMQTYAGIFINCGTHPGLSETKWANLQEYVETGGNLYVSDWAVSALIGFPSKGSSNQDRTNYVSIENKSGDCPDRTGGFISTDQLCTTKSGVSTIIPDASVVNPELIEWLGHDNISIEYDLPDWECINVLGDMWEVLVYDYTDGGYGPLAIQTHLSPSTKSEIVNKSQEWITICHYPPGNPENVQTITINASAWPAHEAHGDDIGSCEGAGGKIIYTTFHNHAGELNSDIQSILEYFIINF